MVEIENRQEVILVFQPNDLLRLLYVTSLALLQLIAQRKQSERGYNGRHHNEDSEVKDVTHRFTPEGQRVWTERPDSPGESSA